MEEEVENKEREHETPPSQKKYITTWRNKWLTSEEGSIDGFIKIYEETAELMKRWKAEGIILDPDIIGGVGDDYAQFCTYDENVAIKEGFEEDPFENLKDNQFEDWDDSVDSEEPTVTTFSINAHLSLKKIDECIQIYVDGEPFDQCRYLLIVDPHKNEYQEQIDSIDEAESLYNGDLETEVTPAELGITKEQEFWAHCSNLQAWAENGYDTRLLHSNLSFPLLKRLTEVGDAKARKVFKDEIAQRFVRGYIPVMRYLFKEKYMDYLTTEELHTVLDELDYKSLNLNLLLVNIEDYRPSKYGTLFLLRVREEFLDFFTHNWLYVEVASHKLDKSEYSPIAVTPNRQYFIRGSNDGKLKEFQIFDDRITRAFGEHTGSVSAIAISDDGKYVASSSDEIVKVWDHNTGALLHSFSGHQDEVNVLVFGPECRYLASGSGEDEMNECAIKIWDVTKGKLKTTKSSHWRSIACLSFSPNGDYLVSGAFDKTVDVWDTSTGTLISTLVGHEEPVIAVAITNDMRVISSSYSEAIRIWDGKTGKLLQKMELCQSEDVKKKYGLVDFVLTPDQEYIITGLQGPSLEDGGMLVTWRISDGEVIQSLPIIQDFRGYEEELNHLTISYDGVFVLSSSRERMVKVWMEFIEYMDFLEEIQKLYE
ncbi:MAG: WD40 repeat domain-containing protein [Candidatus Thorarchaeota archaeon]